MWRSLGTEAGVLNGGTTVLLDPCLDVVRPAIYYYAGVTVFYVHRQQELCSVFLQVRSLSFERAQISRS